MAETADRKARVERLLAAARRLVEGDSREGQALRQRLLETSGLSAAGVELGLTHSLASEANTSELEALLHATPEGPMAHVLLSSNVCIAALRAIAIAVASAVRVKVRASRRDPALAEALKSLVPDLFELTPQLTPRSGDHFWGYGSDETLAKVRHALPPGVWFHAHGHGLGAVVVEAEIWLPDQARAIALDTVLFDQRGCLSPRVVCVVGNRDQAEGVASALARELAQLEREVPPGPRGPEEVAETRRRRDAALYAYDFLEAGSGWVSLSSEVAVPQATRSLHVVHTTDAARALDALAPYLTCISTNTTPLPAWLSAFPGVRQVPLGEMQRPALDGPVDRRQSPLGERLS